LSNQTVWWQAIFGGRVADLDAEGAAGFRSAPDGVRLAALQDHVVAKDRADEGKRLGN